MCKKLSTGLTRSMLYRARHFYLNARWSPTTGPTSLSDVMNSEKHTYDMNSEMMEKITLNTQVTILDFQENQTWDLTLVAPPESQPERGYISFLSMLGSQLMGKGKGDLVTITFFGTTLRYRILQIH